MPLPIVKAFAADADTSVSEVEQAWEQSGQALADEGIEMPAVDAPEQVKRVYFQQRVDKLKDQMGLDSSYGESAIKFAAESLRAEGYSQLAENYWQ